MEGVERMNKMMVYPQQQRVGFIQYNSYAIEVDRSNRNYYSHGGFEHLARNCGNKRIENRIRDGRKLEYGQRLIIEENNRQNNLNREGDLVVLD